VESYNYVGEGLGNFDLSVQEPQPEWCWRGRTSLVGGLLCVILPSVLVFLVLKLWPVTPRQSETRNRERNLIITKAVVTTSPELYDCIGGSAHSKAAWSTGKRRWCCAQHGVQCASENVAATESSTTSLNFPYDCKVGTANRAAWSIGKKAWCCIRYGHACPRTSTTRASAVSPIAEACSSKSCNLRGVHATCSEHIVFASRHTYRGKPGACLLALSQVVEQCDACDVCSPAAANCTAASPLAKAPLMRGTTTTAPDATTTTPQHRGLRSGSGGRRFDCQADRSSWEDRWPNAKKEWCCQHESIACPTISNPEPYDCNADFSKRDALWSNEKMRWCCKHHDRGCMTTV